MFANPAVVSINTVNKSLERTSGPINGASEYHLRTALDEYRMRVVNTSYLDKKRGVMIDRHNVELIQTVFPVAPATTPTIRKTYTVIENQEGDTLVDPTYIAAGLFGFLTASSNANNTKLLNDES